MLSADVLGWLCVGRRVGRCAWGPLGNERRMPVSDQPDYLIGPGPADDRLARKGIGHDHVGAEVALDVVVERPLSIWFNSREIVMAMTIGDFIQYLALGFPCNQGMLPAGTVVTAVDCDDYAEAVVVRTGRETDFEAKLACKTRTSGCAVGTVFGDMMDGSRLPAAELRSLWLCDLSRGINTTPSLDLGAGAIQGTVPCQQNRTLVYMEAVGRHNAVDRIAGWMFSEGVGGKDKLPYSSRRLTSEMVIKCAHMGILARVSRSGFTASGRRDRAPVGDGADRAPARAALRLPVERGAADPRCRPCQRRGRGSTLGPQGGTG